MKQLQHIRAKTDDPGGQNLGRVVPITFRVTNKGLSLPGFLWKIDHFVSLNSIKDKYAESWFRLWRSNTKLEQRSLQATEKLHTFHKMSRVHWLAITHILFEVIRLLREENQINVADAIWHSVTNTDWRNGSCLESVTDFPEQLTVENRGGMFRLGKRSDGCFEHKWLVDRIMFQGGFWIGRLVRRSSDFTYIDWMSGPDGENDTLSGNDQIGRAPQDQRLEESSRSLAQDDAKLNMEMPRAVSASQAADFTRTPAQQPPLTSVDKSLVLTTPHSRSKQAKSSDSLRESDNVSVTPVGKTHSQYQSALFMMTKLMDHVMLMKSDGEEEVNDPTFSISTEKLVEFAASLNNIDGRNSQSSLQQQRAVFDIKGDTSGQVLILTPFQKRLETLPRAETRSMSVSWVVHPLSHLNESQDERDVETLRTSAMVRGMWKFMVHPDNYYNLV